MEQTYTKEQVIAIINELLQDPDTLIDAVTNENTDHNAESLFNDAASDLELPH